MSDQSTPTGTRRGIGPPTAIGVEITSACNLKCKMCALTLGATLTSVRAEPMRDATWSEVVAAARLAGRVILTGFGEVTTNPRFVAMIRELDDLGVFTSFTTNGVAVRPELVAELGTLRKLDHINVSIDSPDPEIYREIRGGGLEKALRGLRLLVDGLAPRVPVTMSSVVMASNVESLLAFPAILDAIGVRIYHLQAMNDRTETILEGHDVARHPRGAEILREIRRACEERGIELVVSGATRIDPADGDAAAARRTHFEDGDPFGPERTRQCMAPWYQPYIDRAGRVYPCCHGDETSVMGQLGESSFDAIWDGEAFRRFRDDLVAGTDMPPSCRKCVNVALGPHPLRFSVQVLWDESRLTGRDDLRLVVRNDGAHPWDPSLPLRIGTLNDRPSALARPDWVLPNRIATIPEPVPPGGLATFTFSLGPADLEAPERFVLVYEGLWKVLDSEFALPQVEAPPAEAPRAEIPRAEVRVDPPQPAVRRPFLVRAVRGLARRARTYVKGVIS